MGVAVLIAVFSQRRRVKEDTVIGIFFAASFALGLVIIARVEGYTASLTSVLFGSITGVADGASSSPRSSAPRSSPCCSRSPRS